MAKHLQTHYWLLGSTLLKKILKVNWDYYSQYMEIYGKKQQKMMATKPPTRIVFFGEGVLKCLESRFYSIHSRKTQEVCEFKGYCMMLQTQSNMSFLKCVQYVQVIPPVNVIETRKTVQATQSLRGPNGSRLGLDEPFSCGCLRIF